MQSSSNNCFHIKISLRCYHRKNETLILEKSFIYLKTWKSNADEGLRLIASRCHNNNLVWLQNNQSCSLYHWTDNNLITFYTMNKFYTRNLQSIWHALTLTCLCFLSLLELNQINSICRLICSFSLFSFLSFPEAAV